VFGFCCKLDRCGLALRDGRHSSHASAGGANPCGLDIVHHLHGGWGNARGWLLIGFLLGSGPPHAAQKIFYRMAGLRHLQIVCCNVYLHRNIQKRVQYNYSTKKGNLILPMKNRIYSFLLALVMVGFVSQVSAQASTWTIDPAHSSIIFSLRHAVTPFIGNFKTFSGSLTWDANHLDKSSVNVTVDPKSVNSGVTDRDNHIMSADFFDAANHGDWSFVSSAITSNGFGFTAKGTLKARGKSIEIPVSFQFLGIYDAGQRGKKAGVTAEFSFKRSDLGLGGDLGGMLGDDVKVNVNLELNGK
jgi:polyisoprenoid-binding protein YceI